MNRRLFLTRAAGTAAVAAVCGARAAGAAALSRSSLQTTDLADNLFMISGGGGNVTVFKSAEGVLLVDGGSPEYSKEVLDLVKQRTGATKIHTLFNTHWHWDQTGSNLALGKSGTRIVAHENTRLWLGTEVNSKWEQRIYPRLEARARPNKTIYTKDSLRFGGATIDYGYMQQAHTDGDIYVHFKEANVLVGGDVVAADAYPVIDYCTNGWIGGMVNALQQLMDLSNADTRVVPGKGVVLTRTHLETERAMLNEMKTRLSRLLGKGSSIDDMLAAKPSQDFDAKWGDPRLFIANCWPGLVARAGQLGVNVV